MNRQKPIGRAGELYQAILLFADGKQYLMRAPIRLWFEFYWESKAKKKENRAINFQETLINLERQGYIRRFPGGIEILENNGGTR